MWYIREFSGHATYIKHEDTNNMLNVNKIKKDDYIHI
jgi:hypothetical protein